MNIELTYLIKAVSYCGVAIASVILFSQYNKLLFIILSIVLFALLYLDRSVDPVIVILSGLVGALTESVIMTMASSSWKYIKPDIYNLPIWLIPLWSIASYGVHNLYKIKMST